MQPISIVWVNGNLYLSPDGSASSCCEILFDLFNVINPHLINARIASALYTGLVADTGSFQYANTKALSLVHGAELIELGASPDEISRSIYESKPYGSLRLMAASVVASRLMYGGQVVVSYVTRNMLADSGALDEDTEGITDELRRIADTKAVVLFKEASDGSIKVSLRGKYGFDVKRIALAGRRLHDHKRAQQSRRAHPRRAGQISGAFQNLKPLLVS